SWRWLKADGWHNVDDVIAAITAAIPELAPIAKAAPAASYRIHGAKIPRSSDRESGRTAMWANIDVSEPKPPEDIDSPLSYSMEGTPDQPPAPLIPFFWKPGWNSIQATQMYQKEVAGRCAAAMRVCASSSPQRPTASSTSALFLLHFSPARASGCWCRCITSSAPMN